MVRPLKYGAPTTERKIRLTDAAWDYLQESAIALDFKARADLVEALVTGEAKVSRHASDEPLCSEQVQSAIDYLLPRIPIKERAIAHKAFKKLLAQLELDSAPKTSV